MGINTKITKIPFLILYLILTGFILFNWIRIIVFQENFEIFRTEQPWDYYLSSFFVNNFGITHQQYFIFALPVILIGLYIIPKIVGKFLNLDKNSNIKGDNHVAIILILLIAPVALGIHKLLGPGWRNHLIPGIILIILFSIWSWIDEKRYKTS
ncbi:hypothetical protein COT44_01550 [Candidatus Shapirobacteria bacterium CG08_land_8_20_14_0_20_39_18]|uniref:DUF2029 domain-containing protein n=1 Tax=Candidatus Shapirobacteria bacterium CG08_land_8_20_14_0_20_39_18 TaxID=1974883 RepID=A0A2M6XDI5_9BACT|nr:MAG: hypothetical protein COT44_01550 [Candidatus Shapirobacteria bacterium CG08_land_8_20_14_0_20_39_18]PIY65157.1 MAG: hypothetical protein COY91_03810 [Candidatus Shapirobacteria bacterium CG_4_10_14_0_8_um_filter_39_15]PJE68013.1 MAG: hypothetical protein COU94_04245 [Candidatus Shapirobacteria bacterium CG10_big_fil_rev_8_21_14_0_10_38_8]